MTLKHPQQYSIVVVSTTVYYFGAFRSFWGEEWGETRPKLLFLITDVLWFWLNFAEFQFPVPVLKTTKQDKHS